MRPRLLQYLQRRLYRRGSYDRLGTEPRQDILGVESDDQAVFDQQYRPRVEQMFGRLDRMSERGAWELDRWAGERLGIGYVACRDAEGGFDALLEILERRLTAQIIGHRSIDDGGAEAAPAGRDHRRTAFLTPVDDQIAVAVALPVDQHATGLGGEAAIFGRVGDELVEHQGHRRIGLRVEQHRLAARDHALRSVGDEGGRLGIDDRADRRRPPVIVGDLVVRARQRVDAAIDQLDELADVVIVRTRLTDQPADHAQDVADAVIEFRDQQLLPRIRRLALGGRLVRQTQHHLDQGCAQGLGDAQFGCGEGFGSALDRFLPFREAFARGEPRAVGAIVDRLVRIACPAH